MNYFSLGEIVTDLAPEAEKKNLRNSEGAFLRLGNGNLIFVYSRFRDESAADAAASDLCRITFDGELNEKSTDILLKCEDEGAMNIMSVSLLCMENGDIGLFYLVRKNESDLKMYLRRSSDEGKTWSDRVLCTDGKFVFVVNNDRVIRLKSGRILIPAAAHPVTETRYSEIAQMTFFYSDDDGRTWQESAERVALPSSYRNCETGLQEPGVIELSDGKLMGWARTDLGRHYQAFSEDGGEHWTMCEPSVFTAPNSPLSMKRLPDGAILAVWNPIPEYNGRTKVTDYFQGGRCPLVLAFSWDNGEHFSEPIAFESEESRGYCYCTIFFTESDLLLAYCAGGIEDKSCLARCRIRKIPWDTVVELENLLKGQKYNESEN